MKLLRASSPDEAVLVWLQAELTSDRFSKDLQEALEKRNLSSTIIKNPNLENRVENKQRLTVLKSYRDWFEDDVYAYKWTLVELNISDARKLSYIDYSYWNELSNHTHLVKVAAENIKQDKIVFDVSNDYFWAIARALDSGKEFAPIILLKDKASSPAKIVEGHARATGYLLASKPAKPLLAILGSAT